MEKKPNKGEFSFPALGNAMGYFAALYFIAKVPWLEPSDESFAVAAMGTIMIHVLQGARHLYIRITRSTSSNGDGE